MADAFSDAKRFQILEEFKRLSAPLEPFTVNIHAGNGQLLRVSATLKRPAVVILEGHRVRLIDLALLAQNKLQRFDASPSLRNHYTTRSARNRFAVDSQTRRIFHL
jgi:hypothetical protein